MGVVQAKDLREQTDDVLRRLRETGEAVEIVDDGQIIARLVPASTPVSIADADDDVERWLQDMDELIEEIAASMPDGITASDLIRDIRRDL